MIVRIGVCGATGKMGQMIIERIKQFDSCILSRTFTRKNNEEDLEDLCKNSDVVIDFSNNELLEKLLDYSMLHKSKLVIGTTGLTEHQFSLLNVSAKNLSILYSANMSLGANLLAAMAAKLATIFDSSYDVEILDFHHRMKKDAPSGTAIMLGQEIAKARGMNFKESAVFDRSKDGLRQKNQIGIASIRGGGVHGEHEVLFLGDNQVFTIKHQVLSRESFADGAIQAALWLFKKPAGFYSMRDIYG